MKTPFLDRAIEDAQALEAQCYLTGYAKEELKEFKRIKEIVMLDGLANEVKSHTETHCHIGDVVPRFLDCISDLDSHGLECGIEDVGITDRYEAMQYGFDECKARALEAIQIDVD